MTDEQEKKTEQKTEQKSYYSEHEGHRHIRKEYLRKGDYYYGSCRNASIARWDGERFWYWRHKFGSVFLESIHVPEDDDGFDLFYAQTVISEPKPIPMKDIEKEKNQWK